MELLSEDAQRIRSQVGLWTKTPEIELEATFGKFAVGGVDKRQKFYTGVDKQAFLRVASRLSSKGFSISPDGYKNSMTIQIVDEVSRESIRYTIEGESRITDYCRTNALRGIPFSVMVKDQTMSKEAAQIMNCDVREYNFRSKLRREKRLEPTDDIVTRHLDEWSRKQKYFRVIRRWSFVKEGFGSFDLSVVRSTKPDARKQGKAWVYTFEEQNIMRSDPIFEIEVELQHTDKTKDAAETYKQYLSMVGEILRGIQNSSMLIRSSQVEETLRGYAALTGQQYESAAKLEFRGVAPYTFSLKNMEPLEVGEDGVLKPNPTGDANIRLNYNVTDKADGLRVHGYVDKEGELFMIDMSKNVYKTGLKNVDCKGSLLDGEYITQDKDGKFIQHLMFFDIYVASDGKDVSQTPFKKDGEEGRYELLQAWQRQWSSTNFEKLKSAKLHVGVKEFLFPDAENDIFKRAGEMLARAESPLTLYNTDGLIFTPNEMGLPQERGKSFPQQLKWKPAKDNTIDFLVRFERDPSDPSKEMIYAGLSPDGRDIFYKIVRLFVGSDRGPVEKDPRMAVLNDTLPDTRDVGKYKPELFTPEEYGDSMSSLCYIECKEDRQTGEQVSYTENEEPISSPSIVEMRYDIRNPPGWRWIPMRVRFDKTDRFLSGTIQKTLNSAKNANDIWMSIHEPVTEHMITTGKQVPSEEELEELEGELGEYKRVKDQLKAKYFDRPKEAANKLKTKGMRDFHRIFIKGDILYKAFFNTQKGKEGRPTILDLATGQGQDLNRWSKGRAGFVLGIDYAGESITTPISGAYARLLNDMVEARKKRYAIPDVLFVVGDSTKPIRDGSAGLESLDQDILKAVFGTDTSVVVPKRVSEIGVGRMAGGADAVVCMFALHYFFEAKEKLDGLIENIRQTLKVGGYFMGCNFDGEEVFKKLRGLKTGETWTGKDGDLILYEVTKQYERAEFPTPAEEADCFGMKIDVKFATIGSVHSEWLMPFQYLKKRLAEIGCVLLDTKEAKKEYGMDSSSELFGKSYEAVKKMKENKFPMTPEMEQFSFLNRWYIFKRTSAGLGGAEEAEVVEGEEGAASAAAADMAERVGAPGAPAAVAAELARLEEDKKAAEEAGNLAAVTALQAEINATTAAVAAAPAPTTAIAVAKVWKIGESIDSDVSKTWVQVPEQLRPFAFLYLAPIKHFPIRERLDASDPTVYPSIRHYLAAMKAKYATPSPAAKGDFSVDSKLQTEYTAAVAKEARGGKLSNSAELTILKADAVRVAKTEAELLKKGFDKGKWDSIQEEHLKDAVLQRLQSDDRFCKLLGIALSNGITILYQKANDSLGGMQTGATLSGLNLYGKALLDVAREHPDRIGACAKIPLEPLAKPAAKPAAKTAAAKKK